MFNELAVSNGRENPEKALEYPKIPDGLPREV
jgi:hypothetical protein